MSETETIERDRGDRGEMTVSDTLKGPLPEDFPGRAALAEAGITSYGKLRSYRGELTEIEGIGEATAKKINEAVDGKTTSGETEEASDAPADGTPAAEAAAAEEADLNADTAPEPEAVPVGETGAQAEQRMQRDRIRREGWEKRHSTNT